MAKFGIRHQLAIYKEGGPQPGADRDQQYGTHFALSKPKLHFRQPGGIGIIEYFHRASAGHRESCHDIERIRHTIGADSLAYLSEDGLSEVVGERGDRRGRCMACFSGYYPLQVPHDMFGSRTKEKLESVWGAGKVKT